MTVDIVHLDIGFKGVVTGLTNAANFQRAVFNFQNAQGRILASSTFIGTGANVPLKREENGLPSFPFGPFSEPIKVNVTITNSPTLNGTFVPSKVIEPVTVTKKPEPTSPETYIVSTILSDDSTDNDFNDCILSIFQFK